MDSKQFPEQEADGFLSETPDEACEDLTAPLPETGTEDAVPAHAPTGEAFQSAEPDSVQPIDIRYTPDSYANTDTENFPQEEAGIAPADAAAQPEEHDFLTAPDLGKEITPDEHAMAWHGMTHPSEPEQPFDLSILDDPDLDITEPEDSEPAEENAPAEEPPAPDQGYRDAGADFDEMFHAEAEDSEIPSHQRPARKGRPRRKKGEGLFGIPHILATVIWLGITIAIGVTLGRMVWICAADVLAFGREDKAVTVTIYESDTIDDITDKLYAANLIRYPQLFKLYASFAVDEGEIHPGIWDLNTRYDYHALVKMMSPSSNLEVVKVMIPEGYTCRQIFQLLEENKVCTQQDLAAYAANGELDDYWFLEDVQRGDKYCLEGFLFPDTYQFYKNDSPKNILEKMLDNFDIRFSEELQEQIVTLNDHISTMMREDGRSEEYIADHQFTIREVVTVASMIEKETASAEEGYTIASVIYNRLFNWGDTPAYLNIDASIIYALDGKTDLTAEDMKVDSPYNTYYHTGLTPGPISNPGLASLKAALAPEDTNYYFYVLNPATGSHQFSTTQEEHDAWRAQFAAAAEG